MFKNKPKLIKNKHNLNIKKISFYVNLIKKNGFELVKKIDLPSNNFGQNYIYLFTKKYGK